MLKQMLCGILFALIILPASPSKAILNVLPSESGEDADGFSGNVAGSLVWETGNVSWLSFNPEVSLRFTAGRHVILLKTSTEYYAEDRIPLLNRGYEHLRYRFAITDSLAWETFVQHQFDEFRHVNFRGLAGTGLALGFSLSDSVNVAIAAAYMFEREIEEATETLRAVENNHRLSSYIQLHWRLMDAVTLGLTSFYQPRVDNFADIRLLGETSLTVSGNKWLAMRLAYSVGYDTQPFAGIEKIDTTTKTSIILQF